MEPASLHGTGGVRKADPKVNSRAVNARLLERNSVKEKIDF